MKTFIKLEEPKDGLLRLRFFEVVSDHDLLYAARKLATHEHFLDSDRQILDFSKSLFCSLTFQGVTTLMQQDKVQFDPIRKVRRAVLAPKIDVFGIFRAYQTLAEDQTMRVGVFRSEDRLWPWLNGADAPPSLPGPDCPTQSAQLPCPARK